MHWLQDIACVKTVAIGSDSDTPYRQPGKGERTSCDGVRIAADGQLLCVRYVNRLEVTRPCTLAVVWKQDFVLSFDVLDDTIVALVDVSPAENPVEWIDAFLGVFHHKPRRRAIVVFDANAGTERTFELPESIRCLSVTVLGAEPFTAVALVGAREVWVLDCASWDLGPALKFPQMGTSSPWLSRSIVPDKVLFTSGNNRSCLVQASLQDGKSETTAISGIPYGFDMCCPLASPNGRYVACQVAQPCDPVGRYAVIDLRTRHATMLDAGGPALVGDAYGWVDDDCIAVPRPNQLVLRALATSAAGL